MECCTHHVSNHAGCHRTHLLKLRPAASLPVLPSSIHCHQTPGHHMCLWVAETKEACQTSVYTHSCLCFFLVAVSLHCIVVLHQHGKWKMKDLIVHSKRKTLFMFSIFIVIEYYKYRNTCMYNQWFDKDIVLAFCHFAVKFLVVLSIRMSPVKRENKPIHSSILKWTFNGFSLSLEQEVL